MKTIETQSAHTLRQPEDALPFDIGYQELLLMTHFDSHVAGIKEVKDSEGYDVGSHSRDCLKLGLAEHFMSTQKSVKNSTFELKEKRKGTHYRVHTVQMTELWRNLCLYMEARVHNCRYSPAIEVLFSVMDKHGLGDPNANDPSLTAMRLKFQGEDTFITKLGKVMAEIHDGLQSKEFKLATKYRKQNADRNFQKVREFVDELFTKRARLLVGRIDFGYSGEAKLKMTVKQASENFSKFKTRFRDTSIGRKVLGYVWSFEYGRERGYHFHLLVFMDGAHHQKHEDLMQQICTYWTEMFAGACAHNCNRVKYSNFPYLGMIHREDFSKRANLQNYGVSYLTKLDQFLMVRTEKGTKTVGICRPNPPIHDKPGRPAGSHSTGKKQSPSLAIH